MGETYPIEKGTIYDFQKFLLIPLTHMIGGELKYTTSLQAEHPSRYP